jgi:hypothetical protein
MAAETVILIVIFAGLAIVAAAIIAAGATIIINQQRSAPGPRRKARIFACVTWLSWLVSRETS